MATKNKPHSIEPVHVTETCWFYPERKGMAVVQEHRDADGQYVGTAQVVIPWNLIRASMPLKM